MRGYNLRFRSRKGFAYVLFLAFVTGCAPVDPKPVIIEVNRIEMSKPDGARGSFLNVTFFAELRDGFEWHLSWETRGGAVTTTPVKTSPAQNEGGCDSIVLGQVYSPLANFGMTRKSFDAASVKVPIGMRLEFKEGDRIILLETQDADHTQNEARLLFLEQRAAPPANSML